MNSKIDDILKLQDAMNRRTFLQRSAAGMGMAALGSLLGQSFGATSEQAPAPLGLGTLPHFPAKAKRIIYLFQSGAPSQLDLWDYKPQLEKRHGEKFDPGEAVELFQSAPDKVMRSPFRWRQYGQSGKWLSGPVAPLGACVDDVAFIHSMVSKSNVHGPATFQQISGFTLPGFPGMGA
jgi:hypothetical protein